MSRRRRIELPLARERLVMEPSRCIMDLNVTGALALNRCLAEPVLPFSLAWLDKPREPSGTP